MSVKIIFKDGPAVFESVELADKFLSDHNLMSKSGGWIRGHMCFVDAEYPDDEQVSVSGKETNNG